VVRFEQMAITGELFAKQLLPRGYLVKNPSVMEEAAIHADFPMYEVGYTLGSILAVIVLAIFLVRTTRTMFKVLLRYPPRHTDQVMAGYGPVMIYFLLTTGTFLYFPTETPFTGLIIGRLLRRPQGQVAEGAGV